ncbi:CU044_5270 family protein [Streptomyces palmae]|uniref:CU044_5270 family protein n=1 Tax=Streptomyces palmae TaxID=1701085 RepID=A0A4Z0HH75_9ACTN|nr:CU044_5270 family protein [Streptomyces palmae]TGB15783.1 hypothetical protein E4099_06135 [Streptomyces palmae]
MQDDTMRRLAAARPDHLDPEQTVDAQTRRIELALAVEPWHEDSPSPDNRRSRWRLAPTRRTGPGRAAGLIRFRPVGVGALTAAAAAAAVVVANTVGGTGAGTEGGHRQVDGSAILLSAASHAEKAPGGGRFWYLNKRYGGILHVPGKNYDIVVRDEARTWVAKGTTKQWQQVSDIGARPATAADTRAWRADGSPKQWDLRATYGERVTYRGAGVIAQDVPGGTSDTVPMVEIDLKELPGLPTDPKELRDRLAKIIDKEYNAPQDILDGMVIEAASYLAMELPASPQQRAAAYRLLAKEPGVRDIGQVTDHEGRRGNAVAIENPHGGGHLRLIFDRENGLPLGEEKYSADGKLDGYTSITARTWTDQAPPFDKDWFAPPKHKPPYSGGGDVKDAEPADRR